MLVLSRKVDEGLLFDDGRIRIVILKIKGRRVQVGIEASAEVQVLREELTSCEHPHASRVLAATGAVG